MSALPFLPDACVQWLRDRVRARRFDRELAHRMSRLDNARANPAAALDAVLLQIIQRPAMTNLRKGAPDTTSVLKDKAEQARSLLGNIHMDDTPGALLALTRWMASADARDADCFHAYGLAFCLVHAPLLDALRKRLTPQVVMHMTCEARIARARQSTESFTELQAQGVSQINVVGSDTEVHRFTWDDELDALRVPVPDTYDHLAGKVAAAYFLLGLLPHVRVVMKVDDDHRAGHVLPLKRVLNRAARCEAPTQWGHRYHSPYPAGHNRIWHLGKCGEAHINHVPHTYMGAITWCTGEHGYVLNRAALLRFVWAHVYFGELVRTALYEDAFVSDTLVRLGGRMRPAPMTQALRAVDAY
jgi:hypothetical protein